MEGNRRIVLLEPVPTGETDEAGERRQGPPNQHVVYAIRQRDPGGFVGGDTLVAEAAVGGEWPRIYTIREGAVSPRPTEDWSLMDEQGMRLSITAVRERTTGARARWLDLVAVRRQTRGR